MTKVDENETIDSVKAERDEWKQKYYDLLNDAHEELVNLLQQLSDNHGPKGQDTE